MCMAVGNVSLELWPRFTSSLGWTGVLEPIRPPASSIARLEMTSLAFMFVCVPEPVWNTTNGKWSSSVPAITSSAARTIRSTLSAGSWPRSPFACAAPFLSTPRARMIARVKRNRSTPIGKLLRERSVCAPQYRSAATRISPMLSFSTRVSLDAVLMPFPPARYRPAICGPLHTTPDQAGQGRAPVVVSRTATSEPSHPSARALAFLHLLPQVGRVRAISEDSLTSSDSAGESPVAWREETLSCSGNRQARTSYATRF